MKSAITSIILLLALSCALMEAKKFERCELGKTLKNKYGLPANQIATWVCIANYESRFDTGAFNRKSGDHGIFQISERWWCSSGNKPGKACETTCDKFRNDDIDDDVACIKKIYAEHQRLSGNGFNAWVAYKKHCKGDNSKWTKGC